MTIQDPIHVLIEKDIDIITARQKARELAKIQGFNNSDLAVIATAISELARNIMSYAKSGTVILNILEKSFQKGILVTVIDDGPGINDINLAMQDGFSTSNSLGLGLPGVKRLMDEFEIKSILGQGTTITVKKWVI